MLRNDCGFGERDRLIWNRYTVSRDMDEGGGWVRCRRSLSGSGGLVESCWMREINEFNGGVSLHIPRSTVPRDLELVVGGGVGERRAGG